MSWTTVRLYFLLDLPLSSHMLTRTPGLQGVYAMNVDTQPCSISATSTSIFSTPSAEAVSYVQQPIHIYADPHIIGSQPLCCAILVSRKVTENFTDSVRSYTHERHYY